MGVMYQTKDWSFLLINSILVFTLLCLNIENAELPQSINW